MQSFEEFKAEQEFFTGKISTPEKFTRLRELYESYLIREQDAMYFEPFDDDYCHGIMLSGAGLSEMLNQYTFVLIRPSFEPEKLLFINQIDQQYILTAITANSSKVVDLSETPISQMFLHLLHHTCLDARRPSGKWATLDGTHYYISTVVDGQRLDVRSGISGGNTAKITAIIDLMFNYITSEDSEALILVEQELGNINCK